jgi:hypothetical protein
MCDRKPVAGATAPDRTFEGLERMSPRLGRNARTIDRDIDRHRRPGSPDRCRAGAASHRSRRPCCGGSIAMRCRSPTTGKSDGISVGNNFYNNLDPFPKRQECSNGGATVGVHGRFGTPCERRMAFYLRPTSAIL